MKISVVIPVYNECETLDALAEGIIEHLQGHEFRIIFVDDGSTDGSFDVLSRLRERFDCVDIIRFRRNFGKPFALAAGFSRAHGDIALIMDADLQDDPKEIPALLAKLEEGFDMVCGWKKQRHDPWHKVIPSRIFNFAIAKAFGANLHDINTGFKVMRMEVARRLPLYGEMHRMIALFALQMGYRVTEIPVEHHPRRHGRSKFGFKRFYRGAIDAFTVWFLSHFRERPAHFFGGVGALIRIAGAGLALASIILALCGGWPLLALALWLTGILFLIGGGLFWGLGLLAEWRLYQRPAPDPAIWIAEERLGAPH
ncbi:MAG TPA: glycosyltransferase family 2 protein [Candidatus Hydrogenedentes bacterium]|nr:glycosyltransferase family 2 protein [Candidatus Hydrogenedentota bacterium]